MQWIYSVQPQVVHRSMEEAHPDLFLCSVWLLFKTEVTNNHNYLQLARWHDYTLSNVSENIHRNVYFNTGMLQVTIKSLKYVYVVPCSTDFMNEEEHTIKPT